MTTAKWELKKAKGYTGNRRFKSHVESIWGYNESNGCTSFASTVVEPTGVNWGDSQLYKRDKGEWTEIYEIAEPGLYEWQEFGEISYRMVYVQASNGELTWKTISSSRATRIAKLMDDQTFEQARLATNPVAA